MSKCFVVKGMYIADILSEKAGLLTAFFPTYTHIYVHRPQILMVYLSFLTFLCLYLVSTAGVGTYFPIKDEFSVICILKLKD